MIAARVDHLVGVQDEEAHVGVVDGGLGTGLPRLLGFFVVMERLFVTIYTLMTLCLHTLH